MATTTENFEDFHIAELEQQLVSIDGRLKAIERDWLSPAHHRTVQQDDHQRSRWTMEAQTLRATRARAMARLNAIRAKRV